MVMYMFYMSKDSGQLQGVLNHQSFACVLDIRPSGLSTHFGVSRISGGTWDYLNFVFLWMWNWSVTESLTHWRLLQDTWRDWQWWSRNLRHTKTPNQLHGHEGSWTHVYMCINTPAIHEDYTKTRFIQACLNAEKAGEDSSQMQRWTCGATKSSQHLATAFRLQRSPKIKHLICSFFADL